jgi:CBS domain containing-hemolysin-like protein
VFTFRIEYRTPFQIKINQLHILLKTFLFCSATFFGLSMQAFGGTNNQIQKAEPDANSSVATELNKLKESSALSPEERARIRRALAAYAKSSGKESSLIEEKQREMLKGLESRFIACDEDNDNTLDLAETTRCLPQVARQFNRLDIDENEVISLDELAFLAKEFEKSYLESNKRKNNQASSNNKTPIN